MDNTISDGTEVIDSADYRIRIAPTLSILFCLILVTWVLYAALGHRIIAHIYDSSSITIVNKLISGRHTATLSNYYRRADDLVISYSIRVLGVLSVFAIAVMLIRNPIKLALATLTLAATTFLLFALLEFCPSLIRTFSLDRIVYYRSNLYRVPDDTLALRGRPLLNFQDRNFRGHVNWALYGVDMPKMVVHWTTDENGFRGVPGSRVSDVVVIGDSFIEYGWDEADTFGKRLEKHLHGWTVKSFGIGGYGPFQYLEVLKRYGVEKRPKIAFFAFFEGNDLYGISAYKQWQKHGTPFTSYILGSSNFFQRYPIAVGSTLEYLATSLRTTAEVILKSSHDGEPHPDLAVLRLPNGETEKMVFIDTHDTLSTDEILRTESWEDLKRILLEFKKVSAENGIVPVVLYIPMAASIYAEFSTAESGENWRRIQHQQAARTRNQENAMLTLCREVGMELVNLGIVFRRAAREGNMVYEPIDTHWNSEGREVAAGFAAETLKSKYLPMTNKLDHRHRRETVMPSPSS